MDFFNKFIESSGYDIEENGIKDKLNSNRYTFEKTNKNGITYQGSYRSIEVKKTNYDDDIVSLIDDKNRGNEVTYLRRKNNFFSIIINDLVATKQPLKVLNIFSDDNNIRIKLSIQHYEKIPYEVEVIYANSYDVTLYSAENLVKIIDEDLSNYELYSNDISLYGGYTQVYTSLIDEILIRQEKIKQKDEKIKKREI